MTAFALHPQLANDTIEVANLALCTVLLMKDATYPWVILVPRRAAIREMHELDAADQQTLMREITQVSARLQEVFKAHKMNVAALGNMVPQLHVHVIARYEGDAAWPAPVWGKMPAVPYTPDALEAMAVKVVNALA